MLLLAILLVVMLLVLLLRGCATPLPRCMAGTFSWWCCHACLNLLCASPLLAALPLPLPCPGYHVLSIKSGSEGSLTTCPLAATYKPYMYGQCAMTATATQFSVFVDYVSGECSSEVVVPSSGQAAPAAAQTARCSCTHCHACNDPPRPDRPHPLVPPPSPSSGLLRDHFPHRRPGLR